MFLIAAAEILSSYVARFDGPTLAGLVSLSSLLVLFVWKHGNPYNTLDTLIFML